MALDVAHMKSLLTVQVFLENQEYHLKIAPGDHLKAYCWRPSENLEDLFICQKGNEIRRDQTLNQPNKPWHMILSSCEPTEYPSPLLRHRPVERDTRTQYGLPRLITRITDGTQADRFHQAWNGL